MYRITTLVMSQPTLSQQQFNHQWLEELVPAIAAELQQDKRLQRLVVNVAPEQLDEEVKKVFPPPYDGLLEFWFTTADEAVACMADLSTNQPLVELAANCVDGAKGAAWLAEVVPSKPDSGSHFKFLAAGDVAQGVPLEEAHAYWRDIHPQVAQTAPDVWNRLARYTQFHGKPIPVLEMGSWLATGRFVPMCSDMGFVRQGDFIELYTCEEYQRIVRPDEEKFSRPGEMLSFVSAEERELINRTGQ